MFLSHCDASKCNRFGHTSTNCKGKERCSKCGGDYKIENCQITNAKCVNCNGNHSAASKECPRYQNEVQVLKILTHKKLTYAEAAKQYRARGSGDSIQYSNSSVYRYNSLRNNNALLSSNEIAPKFGASKNQSQSVNKSVETAQQNCEIQTQSMDDIDFCNNFMFGNPISFIAFLTEVVNRTIMATKADKDVNIYEIITESAGKRMGIPIDTEQLKSMI